MDAQVQLGGEVAVVREGMVIQSFCQSEQPDLFPAIGRPRPFCILNKPGEKFTLQGRHISGLQDTLQCRIQGVGMLCTPHGVGRNALPAEKLLSTQ